MNITLIYIYAAAYSALAELFASNPQLSHIYEQISKLLLSLLC